MLIINKMSLVKKLVNGASRTLVGLAAVAVVACEGHSPPSPPQLNIENYARYKEVQVISESYTPGQISSSLSGINAINPIYAVAVKLPNGIIQVFSVKGFDGAPERADALINPGDFVTFYAIDPNSSKLFRYQNQFREIGALPMDNGVFVQKVLK